MKTYRINYGVVIALSNEVRQGCRRKKQLFGNLRSSVL